MAGHQLIEQHLAELGSRLPAPVVDELADGLTETWEHHQTLGLPADQAAKTAIAEFGSARQISDAFVAAAPGRRMARILLATGPLVGISWGVSLVTAKVWTWPLPGAAAILYGVALLGAVAALLLAATAQHSYTRTRLGTAGATLLAILDTVMLIAVLGTSHLVWPMAFAIPASVARLWFSLRLLPISRRLRRA